MPRKNRTVADRGKSLQSVVPKANSTLAWVRRGYATTGETKYCCTISGYCRTQIFEFPRIDFRPNANEHHCEIYDSPSLKAGVTSNLVDYFAKLTRGRHYAISPCLRHVVGKTNDKIRSQHKGRIPVYLVIEESYSLTPVDMVNGECTISDEVFVQDGEKIPALLGGRENTKYISAWATFDGAWPKLPSGQQLANIILASVRVAQQTPDPILKYVDQSCLVTDDGRFVVMKQTTASTRVETVKMMDAESFCCRAAQIREAIAAMEREIATPHLSLLINSMYSDEHKDDSYKRLQYLRLWQSLVESGKKCLGYQGKIREDEEVVAGKKTLLELREYRDDIAHWWTHTIDERFLADLQRTINELLRRQYFK